MQLPGGARGNAEPSPCLRSFLDVPIRFPLLAPSYVAAIDGVGRAIRQAQASGDWPTLYAAAIRILEALVADADRRLDDLQRILLTADDPNEIRQRLSQNPRREAERARNDAKAEIRKVLREWSERAPRQQEQIATTCLESLQGGLHLEEARKRVGIEIRIDRQQWSRFREYFAACCEQWTNSFTAGLEADVATAVQSAYGPRDLPPGVGIPTSPVPPVPPVDALPGEECPVKEVEIPGVVRALMQEIRNHMMQIGFFGSMLAGALFSSATRKFTVFALPIVLGYGYKEVRHHRALLRERGFIAARQGALTFSKTEIERALDRHRRTLDRWATDRADRWAAAIEEQWSTVVEPLLTSIDAAALAQSREIKIQQAKLQEEQANLRALRNQLAQTHLFELRKRHREIVDPYV